MEPLWTSCAKETTFIVSNVKEELVKFFSRFWKIGPTRLFLDRITSNIKDHEKLCKFNLSIVKMAGIINEAAKHNLRFLYEALEGQKDLLFMTGIISSLSEVSKDFQNYNKENKNLPPATTWKERAIRWYKAWPGKDEEKCGRDVGQKISRSLYLLGNVLETPRMIYKYVCQSALIQPFSMKLGELGIAGFRPFSQIPVINNLAKNNLKDPCILFACFIEVGFNGYKYIRPEGKIAEEKQKFRKRILKAENLFKQGGNLGKIILITSSWADKLQGKWKYWSRLGFAVVDIATQSAGFGAHVGKAIDLYEDLE